LATHRGRIDPNTKDVVVKVREFKLPGTHIATDSIIVGPDHNIWFAELRAIATLAANGKIREAGVDGGSDPGTLTSGPDGNVWANAAEFAPPNDRGVGDDHFRSAYTIYRVTPSMQRTTFTLPKNTDQMPTNLLKVGSGFYFGYQRLLDISNSESYLPLISTIDANGKKQAVFKPHSHGEFLAWIDLLETAGPTLWLYDYHGGMRICGLTWHCKVVHLGYPYELLDNLHAMALAHSRANDDVYVADLNDWTIEKLSIEGARLKGYRNPIIQEGYGALAYYRGNIWVTLNGDEKGRPMLGRLTPSNEFSEISLPFPGPTAAVTAMVGGPDGHLWYLRGNHIGEVLARI
jgi:hypothetical protein